MSPCPLSLSLSPSCSIISLQDESRTTWSRPQRRLLHLLSQAAEKELWSVAKPEMPPLQAGDEFHPATKSPRCK